MIILAIKWRGGTINPPGIQSCAPPLEHTAPLLSASQEIPSKIPGTTTTRFAIEMVHDIFQFTGRLQRLSLLCLVSTMVDGDRFILAALNFAIELMDPNNALEEKNQ